MIVVIIQCLVMSIQMRSVDRLGASKEEDRVSVWCIAAQCPLFIFHFMTKTHKTQVTCSLLTSNDRYLRRFKAPVSQVCQCPSHLYPVQMSHFCAGQMKLVV